MVSKKKRLAKRLEAATKSHKDGAPAPTFDPFEEPPDPPVELAAFIAATLAGLLIIAGLAIFYGTRAIEGTLERQTLGLLRSNGLRSIEVDASGLEVTLVGTVREEGQVALAIAIAHSIEGVVDVNAQNVVYVPPDPEYELEIVAEPLVFSWDATGLRVEGTVSDEPTRRAVLEAVAETWENVDASGLAVKEGTESERDWLPAILQVLRRAGEDLPEGTVIANAASAFVLVQGELETRGDQVAVRRDVEDILSALTFDFTSGLTVAAPPPPPTPAPGSSPSTSPTTSTTVPPEVVELQETLDDLIGDKIVEFDFASARITAEGRMLLDEVLEALREFPDVQVQISGHTDDVGTPESNLLLSRLRAASVLAYLVDNGEDASRFEVVGFGESQPIADNATSEGRARNRRIEFTALSE
jgi:outer membrane protein OmpA-like peptidoglycan-associated protein